MARTVLLASLGDLAIDAARTGFAAEGFEVDSARSESRALAMVAMRRYDALLLFSRQADPLVDVLDALAGPTALYPVPTLCICTMGQDDEIGLLSTGASVCLRGDVQFPELLARTRAVLRRVNGYPRHYRIADLGIDPIGRRASRRGRPLALRSTEFDLLLCLAEQAGEPVATTHLIQRLWPQSSCTHNRLAVHIRNLRSALEIDPRRRLLHTVRSYGYMLAEDQHQMDHSRRRAARRSA